MKKSGGGYVFLGQSLKGLVSVSLFPAIGFFFFLVNIGYVHGDTYDTNWYVHLGEVCRGGLLR